MNPTDTHTSNGLVEFQNKARPKTATKPQRFRRPDFGTTVFTTSHIAYLCKVAPRTVSKWANSGVLKTYRIPLVTKEGSKRAPNTGARRFCRDDVIAFIKERGLPMPPELITVSSPWDLAASLHFPTERKIENVRAIKEIELGIALAKGEIQTVLMGCREGIGYACQIVDTIREQAYTVRKGLLLSEDRTLSDCPDEIVNMFDKVFPYETPNDEIADWCRCYH